MSALQIVAAVICVVITVIGVSLLVRAVAQMVARFKVGAPEKRTDNPGARTVTLLREFLGHTRMSRLPIVAVAHWFTMISFGILFFTLVTAYGQIFNPDFTLPIIGTFAPWEWLTEFMAWTGFLGICWLIWNRRKNHPGRSAGKDGRKSRFFGSSFWQAYYVEFTIFGVGLCIVSLRALEYALGRVDGSHHASVLHFPMTFFLGKPFESIGKDGLEQLIVVIAAIKILISMAWMITISLNTTMGVAWHRFLAFPNIWFKRNADGRTALGAAKPMMVDGEPLKDVEELELDEDTVLGVGKVEDFTWKGLLDFSTCTECGRCQSQCPAWNTEKPLSPKLLMMTLRDHSAAKAPFLQALSLIHI